MVLLMHEIVRHFLACTGLTSTFALFSSGAGAGAFFVLAFLFFGAAAAAFSGSKASTLLFVFLAPFLGIFV